MEITIKIDSRRKEAKAFLEYMRSLSFISFPKAEKEPKYDPDFVKMILEAEKRAEYTTINPDDVWGSLGLK